jgi:ATP-dependent Clp protease adaptor protein ClpS
MAPRESQESDIAVQESDPQLKEPAKFAVLLHNDDYTTMEFVIEVLQKFFHKTTQEAMEITLKVHHEGKGLAGIYGFQIAETKVSQVNEYAQSNGYPLKSSAQEI